MNYTRREFVRSAAAVLALPQLPAGMGAAEFAYAAAGNDSIRAFRVHGEQWTPIQQTASAAPAAMVRLGNRLYVANDVEIYDRLPRGSIECFAIGSDGRLAALGRTALSLAATHPRSMAVSPDGKLLAVAAYGGGIYNLFALAADGGLGRPCGIFKDMVCPHPDSLLFAANGKQLIATDSSCGRRSVLALDDTRLLRT